MQNKCPVSFQITCFDIGFRLYITVSKYAVTLQSLAHHGIPLPMSYQTHLRDIFIVYTEQSGLQVEYNAFTGKEITEATVQGQILGSTDSNTVHFVHKPDFIGYLQSQFKVVRRKKNGLVCLPAEMV